MPRWEYRRWLAYAQLEGLWTERLTLTTARGLAYTASAMTMGTNISPKQVLPPYELYRTSKKKLRKLAEAQAKAAAIKARLAENQPQSS